jgi:DNA-binding transcriptional LysR family regulator
VELRHLATFRAVAGSLSFTRAAAQLGYVQSAVTTHVKALEDELGVRLFDRLGRGIVLTHAGTRLLDYADRILDLTSEAASVVGESAEPAGRVVVSAPEVLCTYRLPAVIGRLHTEHPKVQIVFRANPTGALDAPVRRSIANGDIDLAVVLEEQLGEIDTLAVEHLTSEPLVLIAAPDHPLTRQEVVGPEDLDGAPVLLTDPGCPYRRAFERALGTVGARAAIAGEFTSGEAVKRVVQAGTAIGVLASVSVAAELESKLLTALPWSGPPLTLNSYMVSSRQRWVSPAQAALQQAARQCFDGDPAR